MGTRGLFGFRKNDHDKAVYHHYDSYPDGLGREFVDFIKIVGAKKLKDFFEHIQEIDPNLEPTEKEMQMAIQNGWYEDSVSERSPKDWYCLLRNLQDLSQWQNAVEGKKEVMIDNYIDFIKDSLFCEYAYILNLDTDELEYYIGFQRVPDDPKLNRYIDDTKADRYYPCKLALTIPIQEICEQPSAELVQRMKEVEAE